MLAPPPNLVPPATVCAPHNQSDTTRPGVDISDTDASVQKQVLALPAIPVPMPPSGSEKLQLHEIVTMLHNDLHETVTDSPPTDATDNETTEETPTAEGEARKYVYPPLWETSRTQSSPEPKSMKNKSMKKNFNIRQTEYSYQFHHERADNPYLGRRRVFTGHGMESLPSCKKTFS